MMSSLETSSPVSASTLACLMRWPVFLLIWLKLTFSESEVAGYKATGQVTSERRKKPFQLARGAIEILQTLRNPDLRRSCLIGSDNQCPDAAFSGPLRDRTYAPPNPPAAQRNSRPSAGRHFYKVRGRAAGSDANQGR